MTKKAMIIPQEFEVRSGYMNRDVEVFRYNVQILQEQEPGCFVYWGHGRYCHDLEEAKRYAADNADAVVFA